MHTLVYFLPFLLDRLIPSKHKARHPSQQDKNRPPQTSNEAVTWEVGDQKNVAGHQSTQGTPSNTTRQKGPQRPCSMQTEGLNPKSRQKDASVEQTLPPCKCKRVNPKTRQKVEQHVPLVNATLFCNRPSPNRTDILMIAPISAPTPQVIKKKKSKGAR